MLAFVVSKSKETLCSFSKCNFLPRACTNVVMCQWTRLADRAKKVATLSGHRFKSSIGISEFKVKKIVFRITATKICRIVDFSKSFYWFFFEFLLCSKTIFEYSKNLLF